jgi:hypothetical protein
LPKGNGAGLRFAVHTAGGMIPTAARVGDGMNTVMKAPMSVRAAEDFSRVRLSQSFFMRDFLFSEIAAIERMSNLPDDPKLAIQAGRGLCENLLEPLQANSAASPFDRRIARLRSTTLGANID